MDAQEAPGEIYLLNGGVFCRGAFFVIETKERRDTHNMANRVLIISQNFYPEIGSAGNRIKNIFKQLDSNIEKVSVLTTNPTYPNRNIYEDHNFWDDASLNQKGGKITRIQVSNKKYSFSIFNRLFYYLEVAIKMLLFVMRDRDTYDIVYVTSPPIFIGLVGLVAKWRYKARLFLDVRDLWPDSLKGVGVFNYPFILYTFGLLEKLLYKRSNEIIVNSKGFIEHIKTKANIPVDRISHIPNSAILEELPTEQEVRKDFKVIYAGNIGLAQDAKILMELARKLLKHKIQLVIVAYGFNKNQLAREIQEKKLSNVVFIKPTTRKVCLNLIADHDVGIVTLNNKEVFDTVLPGKIVDYMTCGVPIVASVSGFSKDVIEKAEVGFVSETHSADEMLEKILFLKDNPEEKKRLSGNALNYVKEHFLWEKNIKLLTDLISKYPSNKKQEKAKII